jgi:sugar phosphate isomerase/epimerase
MPRHLDKEGHSLTVMTRRRALSCLAAAGVSLLPLVTHDRWVFAKAPAQPLGIQLYTLGPDFAKDLDANLAKVKAIGYTEVELPGFYGRKASELRAALDGAGLACPSVHVPGPSAPDGLSLSDDLVRLSDEIARLGAHTVVMPFFLLPARSAQAPRTGEDRKAMMAAVFAAMTRADWQRTADFLNEKAAILARSGLHLAYHNHNPEFAALADGSTGYEVLMQYTDPVLVSFELDVGWAAAAGQDPVAVLAKNPSRFTLMHLKDLNATAPNTLLNMNPADVGSGIIAWPALLRAARAAGIAHYYLEQEPPFPRPPLESARIGFNFLRRTFLSIDR